MSILLHGDCLNEMKGLEDDSVDLIFCDLPYGQTSCKWDCPIDLDLFWIEIMRIKKLNTPIFFTTTTKFGVSLINSAPKKCHFRYDIVWVKSAAAGFLSAKKMPMRKHEMIYVFYEKLPFYDLSSHTHKFKKETNEIILNMLVQTVNSKRGTASNARLTDFIVAGKTGTAKESLDEETTYTGTFAGFVPYNNPEYLAVVVLSGLSGEDYSGGKVSAPVFS